jgi:tetratricopeptide (TPR) repeat protein
MSRRRTHLSPILLTGFLFSISFFLRAATAAPVNTNPAPAATNPLNRDPKVREAFDHFYIMDYPGALSRFEAIRSEHPNNPIATDYLLYTNAFSELFRLDLLDTTFYANDGFLTGKHTVVEDPQLRDHIKGLTDQAVDEANRQLKANENDVNALFARGWARSLDAVYLAMVERSFGSALRLASQAHGDNEKVLQLNPNYVDAKLVVGNYEYVLGALSLPFKILMGFAGIHGSKATGMELLRDAGARGVITSVEARTCMMLFLRREAKYQEAEQIAEGLVAEYPRDFLFRLEVANLQKDAGMGLKAISSYREVIELSKKPGYFASSHLELVYFGLGDTLRGQRLYADAVEAFNKGAYQPTTSPELKRRCLLAAGLVYDLMHDHDKARRQYQAVIDAGSDSVQADQARKFMKTAYSGR